MTYVPTPERLQGCVGQAMVEGRMSDGRYVHVSSLVIPSWTLLTCCSSLRVVRIDLLVGHGVGGRGLSWTLGLEE